MSAIYCLAGRLAGRISEPTSRFFLNRSRRCRIVVLNGSKILLVKGWLGRQDWSLPGGGIKGGETVVEAAIRELKEESGLSITPADLKIMATEAYVGVNKKLRFPLTYLFVEIDEIRTLKPRPLEILAARWFDVQDLPANLSLSAARGLELSKVRTKLR